MAYSRDDAAVDSYYERLSEEALLAALEAAQRIASEFTAEHSSDGLRPELTSELTAGGDDQPLLRFTLLVTLPEDFDADDFPSREVDDLTSDARRRVEASDVDSWDWYVFVKSKAPLVARD